MRLFDISLPSPAENLALDEALLDVAEETGVESLRFWESETPFVVLGYGNHRAKEVQLESCARDGIPVLRRCSGGGTVLQGSGCLNYNLVLTMEHHPALESIPGTNKYIMECHRAALEELLGEPVAVQGHSDLTFRNLKFSGNAQRRKRRALVFHGTFLYSFDLSQISRWLQMPTIRPDYREERPHAAFVANLPLEQAALKRTIAKTWNAGEADRTPPMDGVRRLVESKYGDAGWNERF